ncbi:MAG TPA: hypothetical protein VFQ20_01510 [Burkholderiaceae bacterium]|nr:hypothetical protein [Burkholderiaceae bacterium]
MQHAAGASILTHLAGVEAERAARAADPDFAARVNAIKAYQQRRFAHAYADLLAHPRYAGAARFFLDELYGPADFTQRDAQFARIVPALVRLFPAEVIDSVLTLAQLHALSEGLDSAMARALAAPRVDAPAYVLAWQRCGQPAQRETQIALILRVGADLDRLTHNRVLRHSLRLMRAPARAAGLAALQSFLESGFDTFRAMGGADEFLRDIGRRERALAAALFAIDARDAARLGQLP